MNTIFSTIRKKKVFRFIAAFIAINMLTQIFFPTIAWALTSGPSQPEMQSFEPAGTSDMVDLFSGDFNYNIPLFDLPGPNGSYPFNLTYHSGIGMDQEASWTGLGWNINPGAINRDKRGLPDDFKGEQIDTYLDMKPNETYGGSVSVDLELWGGSTSASAGNLSLGLTVYNNSYKGIGYSFDPSISMTSENASVGLGLSLDSQEGVGANADIAFGKNMREANPSYVGLGAGFNSQRGLSISAFGRIGGEKKSTKSKDYEKGFNAAGSSTYSFAEKAYMPAFTSAMGGSNLQVAIKFGADAGGAFPDFAIGGFYRIEGLKKTSNTYLAYGYNYLESADTGPLSLMDFNREKDGIIRKETPNLPAPVLTHDTYMALGQGFLGSYRAHRSDVGHLHDPYVESKIFGGAIGVDLGFGYPFHLGIAASFNETNMNSGDWTENNGWETGNVNYTFQDGSGINIHDYEKLYYKIKGEPTSFNTDEMDYIGGESAVRARLSPQGSFLDTRYNPDNGHLISSSGSDKTVSDPYRTSDRINRDNSIQPITNELLLPAPANGSTELLGEYQIKYYNSPDLINGKYNSSPAFYLPYNRSGLPKNQTAGFTCINPSGLRYVYALPAYNKTEKEIAFTIKPSDYTLSENTTSLPSIVSTDYSADATTEQFCSRTVTPAYSHAHLLTAVLGADYVDADNIPGPSEGDYGYWVKFNYVKTSTDYQWRAPYEGAMYLRGQNLRASDDKAMFNYGTKEIWYLASAETKSHIAVFKLSERHDGMEAKGEYIADNNGHFQKLYKVDEINLYSKPDYNTASPLVPLKTVHFDYNYDLCGHVPNNDGSSDVKNVNQGKLTLKKVWFTYQNNTRGELSPYTFDYHENFTDENPVFNADSYDRWGGYKDGADFYKTKNLPYVSQFDPGTPQTQINKSYFKTNIDKNASVWSLKSIGLPTGGSIDITYESDDYAYVQHRQATQMFQILKLSDPNDDDVVYDSNDNPPPITPNKRKIYFKLENPIPVSNNGSDVQKLYNDYLAGIVQADGNLQMYFRLKSKLRDNVYETVCGYCNLKNSAAGDYGFDDSSPYLLTDNNVSYHTVGYVTYQLMSGNNSAFQSSGPTIVYHPFAVAAWQYMRINEPELLTAFGNLGNAAPGSSAMDKAMKVKNLLSVIPAIAQTFKGYRKYAFNHGWGNKIDRAKSFIRLGTPDKIKYGGGLRVKRITYHDNWMVSAPGENSNSYGQVYNYTTTEGTGDQTVTISSGVAQYEPLIGGDEIALRHAKNYMQTIPLFTDNNLFFEYPINESYYPAPNVGYSKVTVQSIASYNTSKNNQGAVPANFPISTTGTVEYQFYTAKEYPVITDETDNLVEPFNLFIPIPLIGQITSNKLYETQGYAITLNDMHGKLKSITNYSKNINGEINPIPVSSVRYHYKSSLKQFDGQMVNVLDNKVPAIVNEKIDTDPTHTTPPSDTYQKMICVPKNVIMGEEYDFFVDSRQSHVSSAQGGLALNIEFATPIPFPCPWPSISKNTKNLKTLATNKVIQKSAILDTTIATDGQSIVKTYNKLFDAQTGSPLLTVVTNDFDKPVYNYNHPAYWDYDGMGAAAKNHNFSFYAKVNTVNTSNNTFTIYNGPLGTFPTVTKNVSSIEITSDNFYKTIAEGDELIIQPVGPSPVPKYMATLITKNTTYDPSCGLVYNLVFHSAAGASTLSNSVEVKFTIVRSGRRNMLSTNIGSIAALKDPTDDANRGLFTTTAGTVNIAPELVILFNSLLHSDCDPSDGLQLPLTTINFSGEEYFNQNGVSLYPTLSNFFNYITIGTRPATQSCNPSPPAPSPSGGCQLLEYFMKFSYKNESGICQQGECCLGLYGLRCCIASGNCVLLPYPISGFSSSNNNLVFYYPGIADNPATVKSVSLDCITAPTDLKYTYIDDVISSSSVLYRHFWDYDSWANVTCEAPPAGTADQTNLYSLGKKGIWKPYMNYYYKDERVNEQLSSEVKLKHDGVYKGTGNFPPFNEFYLFKWNPTIDFPMPLQWMPNSLVVMYDQNSNAVQTQDIVKINSSVLYGYNNQLPIIQGNNAERNELYYQSFDDPSSSLNYALNIGNYAHTGKNSLFLAGGYDYPIDLNSLSLKEGKSYSVSLWVGSNLLQVANLSINTGLGVKLVYYDINNNVSYSSLIRPSGNVIEGWQRIEGDCIIPAGTKKVGLSLKTIGQQADFIYFFDDIRIFPTLSNVSTSVYDVNNFRIAAVLDANNYATFYNYDEEGKLFMVKKETIDGIKTIKEERGHIKEQF